MPLLIMAAERPNACGQARLSPVEPAGVASEGWLAGDDPTFVSVAPTAAPHRHCFRLTAFQVPPHTEVSAAHGPAFLRLRQPLSDPTMLAKRLSIALAGLMLVYASAAIVFDTWFRGDRELEALLCKALLCANDLVVAEGFEKLWDPDPEQARQSVALFQQALVRDPASPTRWSDLGDAFLRVGEPQQARYCFQRALELGPYSPPILLRAAHFHINLGERRLALPPLAKILSQVRAYDEVIFSLFRRFEVPVTEILVSGLPPERDAAQAYFRELLRHGPLPDAMATWSWLRSHSLANDVLFSQYIDFLLAAREYDAARQTLISYAGRHPRPTPHQYVWNPGFELDPTGSVLDWTIRPVQHADVSRDRTVARRGSWSLRITFDGQENSAYSHVSQEVIVTPGNARFQAFLRSDRLTTDQGLGFRIRDAEDSSRLDVRTEQVVGTSDWQALEATFLIPAKTRLLQIQLERRPSNKLDNKISGSAWIDDVSLVPQ